MKTLYTTNMNPNMNSNINPNMNPNMNPKEYKCNICRKFYASYKSLWDHNKKFHRNQNVNNNHNVNDNTNQNGNNTTSQHINNTNQNGNNTSQNINNTNQNINNTNQNTNKIIKCEFCNKIFLSRFAKSNHKKKACKFNPNNSKYCNNSKLDMLEKENSELRNENENIKKSLNKIEKQLLLYNSKQHYILKPKDNFIKKINKLSNNYTISNKSSSNMFINFSENIFIFNNNHIKFFYHDYQIFFKAKDIARILNYENGEHAIIEHVNVNDKFRICDIFENELKDTTLTIPILVDENIKTMFISESGLYSLLFNSSLEKQEIVNFKRYIIYDIFPAIRRNGSYNIINNYIEEDLDKYYKKDCVYIIHVIDNIYKYGYTSSVAKRLQHHKNTLKYTKIIKIYEMLSINQIVELEKKIKKLIHVLNINRVLYNELTKDTQIEIFEIDNDNLYNIIEKIDEFSNTILNK